MENLKENYNIKHIAQKASLLQYGALAKLLEAISNIKKCPGKEFLEQAALRLNEAWFISKDKMQKEDFKKHSDDWQEILKLVLDFEEKDFKNFFRLLAHFLNNQAEKDYKKRRIKLVKILLTNKESAVQNLRRASGLHLYE